MKKIISILLMAMAVTSANAVVLNDAGTHTLNTPKLEWKNKTPTRSGADPVIVRLLLHVNLDMRSHKGKTGRVYLVMPIQSIGDLSAKWQPGAILQGGEVKSGQRSLIYAGQIGADFFVDTLSIEVESLDIRVNNPSLNINFEFDSL